MRTALRAIGISTIILWVFAGAFVALTMYSALQISIESISTEALIQGTRFIVRANITLFNGGYFDITDIDITTALLMSLVNVELNRSSTSVPEIGAGGRGQIAHEFEFDVLGVLGRPEVSRAMLLNSSDLELALRLSLTYAMVFTIVVDANATAARWGAPLSGFKVKGYAYSPVDGKLSLNVAFRNELEPAIFGGTAPDFTFWLRALNEHRNVIGESSQKHGPKPGGEFDGLITIPIPPDRWTGRGWIVVYVGLGLGFPLCTEVLKYGW